jgi:hypothetical protein
MKSSSYETAWNPPGCLQVHHDRAYRPVTREQIAEQEELDLEALDHLNKARTQIASAIAHLEAGGYKYVAKRAREVETLVISEIED